MKIGHNMQWVLDFCRKYPGRHHIGRDRATRNAATSLENMGLLRVDRAYECWIVSLIQ